MSVCVCVHWCVHSCQFGEADKEERAACVVLLPTAPSKSDNSVINKFCKYKYPWLTRLNLHIDAEKGLIDMSAIRVF